MVPAYYRSRRGRMFRVQRTSERPDANCARYILRAYAIRIDDAAGIPEPVARTSRDVQADVLADKIRHRLAIATTEALFEQLWQQLRVELDGIGA